MAWESPHVSGVAESIEVSLIAMVTMNLYDKRSLKVILKNESFRFIKQIIWYSYTLPTKWVDLLKNNKIKTIFKKNLPPSSGKTTVIPDISSIATIHRVF